MPIYNENRSRYPKLRVAVSVNRELRQKYFSLVNTTEKQAEAILEKAKALESKWQKEAHKIRQSKKIEAKPKKNCNPVLDSGVSGIKMKWRRRQTGAGMHYAPMFLVSVAEGSRQSGIIDAGHKSGWKKAINLYCELKEIKAQRSLLKRIPPKSKWDDVRQYYITKLGWDIPEVEIKD